mgnify:FL=1
MWLKGGKNGRTLIKKYKGGTLVTIKGYTNNPELRKKEVIPGTFDAVFKAVLTEEKEVLAEIIELVIGIPKEEVLKNGVIINSEYVRENIIETDKKSDLLISIGDNVINLEMDRRYYSGSNKKNNKYIHKIVNHYNPKNTVQICFTSYKEGEELKGEKKSIRKYMFQDSDGNVEDYGLEKYKIDLEYIENKYYNNDELTRREKIFLMFKESNREILKEISKGDKIMDKIYKRLDKLSEDEALSLLYDAKEREEEKKQAEIEYAEEHGLNKGIKQTAKNMLERNMNIDVVAEITGLSLEEVIKLKEDI